jgi:hypothetical protein
LHSIVKLTAPCWTRSINHYPPLANQICKQWKTTLSDEDKMNTPCNIPKAWQKTPRVAQKIMKVCPFCNSDTRETNGSIGNLEHLHQYCTGPILVDVRNHCNQKIEDALFDIYDYASIHGYNLPFNECNRISTLQENLENCAVELKKTERLTVQKSKLLLEARETYIAILSKNTLNLVALLERIPNTLNLVALLERIPNTLNLVALLERIPAEKINDYNKYPLSHRIGFIHSLMEKDFDMAFATIIDVGFLGLFPKPILYILNQYSKTLMEDNTNKSEFLRLVEKLVTAFVYWPISIQKLFSS